MQIDFHHGVTYVLARLAGFTQEQADIIAHSSQYVDDAVHDGLVTFHNRALFRCSAAAHKSVDYRNFEALKNHLVWIPFHFLPGNQTTGHPDIPDFVQRLICRPNSEIAQAMVNRCILDQDPKLGLYRLGITLHVYADTWAHQNFTGISHEVNIVKDILNWQGESDFAMNRHVHKFFNSSCLQAWINKFKSTFLTEIRPLGHGTVLSFPDRPYLKWQYVNHWGEVIKRNNPEIFMDAVIHLYEALVKFLHHDIYYPVDPLKKSDLSAIETLLTTLDHEDGDMRHKGWLNAIRQGLFSFGAEEVQYHLLGPNSWQSLAFGKDQINLDKETFPFQEDFMKSHWKLFYDAISNHRHTILHEILPDYGICAA